MFELADATNQHFQRTQPWTLAKGADQRALDDALYSGAEALRIVAHLLWPYLPETSVKIATALNARVPGPGSAEEFTRETAWGRLRAGNPLRPVAPLFPRIETGEKVAT